MEENERNIMVDESEDAVICITGVRGEQVKNPGPLSFSFYFSSGNRGDPRIRVRPVFDPKRLLKSKTGVLTIGGDWNYLPGPDDSNVSEDDVNKMKQFFKDHSVLFQLVWAEQLDDGSLEDYFTGKITLGELMAKLEFYEKYEDKMKPICGIKELEIFARGRVQDNKRYQCENVVYYDNNRHNK